MKMLGLIFLTLLTCLPLRGAALRSVEFGKVDPRGNPGVQVVARRCERPSCRDRPPSFYYPYVNRYYTPHRVRPLRR